MLFSFRIWEIYDIHPVAFANSLQETEAPKKSSFALATGIKVSYFYSPISNYKTILIPCIKATIHSCKMKLNPTILGETIKAQVEKPGLVQIASPFFIQACRYVIFCPVEFRPAGIRKFP
jgi:hypothetical protein